MKSIFSYSPQCESFVLLQHGDLQSSGKVQKAPVNVNWRIIEVFCLRFMKTSRCFVLEENLLQNEFLILSLNILAKP